MECLTYCIAEKIRLAPLEKACRAHFQTNRHWDALALFNIEKNQWCFIFANGTFVTWNVKRHQIRTYLDLVLPFAEQTLRQPLLDYFFYQYGKETSVKPHDYFNVDCISLETDESDLKLSFSYACSQSIKLKFYETNLERTINHYQPMINSLSTLGGLPFSRKKIRQILGQIISERSRINLQSNFLYQPKFFWKRPTLEPYYLMLDRYLDIAKRTNVITKQFDTLNEIFLMINTYLENRQAHFLEIIVIVLIMTEILFNFLNIHWGFF